MTAENTHTGAPHGAPPLPPAGPPQPPPAGEQGPAAPAPPGPRPQGRRGRPAGEGRGRRLWHFLVDRGTELLAAVLTLVAAVLGVWGAQLNNENEELAAQVDTLEDTGGVLREDNASLTEDLADMTASRDSWKARAEEAREDDGTTPTTEPEPGVDPDGAPGDITPGAAGIFRQTGSAPVTFAVNYGIDLDSQEPNWSVGPSSGDVVFGRRTNGFGMSTYGRVALVSSEARYEDCDAQTVLQDNLTKEQTVVGSQFCTLTSEERWAYVKIVGLDPERETVTLHVVVYSLESD
jgi:hypothetical protein